MVGGIADYTQRLAQQLAAAGVDVGVLTGTPADPIETERLRVFAEVGRWSIFSLLHVLRRARAFDLVHLQYQAAAFDLGIAAPLLADWLRLRGGPPLVTTFHDLRVPYLFPKAGVLRERSVRRLALRSHTVITTNVEDEARLRDWGVCDLVRIPLGNNIPATLPDGFERKLWREQWEVRSNEWLLVHFGLINRSKGVPTLLRAQNRLLTAGLPVKVMFVGERVGASDPTNTEHLQEIEQLIEELNLGNGWTLWTGHVPAQEIAAALAASDVVVLPYTDGASLRRTTLITALAHGCAVVTTEPKAEISLLRANHNVAFARAGAPGDVARRVNLLLRREDMRRRLARGAAELSSTFDWEQVVVKHRDVYASVVRPS